MGKLSELWQDLKATSDDVKKKEIQKKINDIEEWMIDNKFGSIKNKTDWSKQKTSKTYRFESVKDGGHQIPVGAKVGREMCLCCRYNKHSYCGMDLEEGDKPCWANV